MAGHETLSTSSFTDLGTYESSHLYLHVIPRTNMTLLLAMAGYASFRVSFQCRWVLDVIPG